MTKSRDRVLVSLLVAWLAIVLPVVGGEREWKDKTGKFSVTAEFVEISGANVRLRRSDGQVISVPINKLSDNDQLHLALLRSAKQSPHPPAENLDIVLVRNGTPVHNMVCLPNDEADPAAVLALKEYRALVKKATGIEPVRVEKPESGKPTIFFGRNSWSTKAGVTVEGLPSEGFRIRSIGQDIHIIGRDTPKVGAHQVAGRVGMEPGTLFGTYEFLERYYEMLFAWHDDLGTVTPPQENLTIKSMHIVDGPDCSYRQFTKSPEGQVNEVFGRRLRLGHPIDVRHEHNWHRIMPPADTTKCGSQFSNGLNAPSSPLFYLQYRSSRLCRGM